MATPVPIPATLSEADYWEAAQYVWCPYCQRRMTVRTSYSGRYFLGCTGFPRCKGTLPIKSWMVRRLLEHGSLDDETALGMLQQMLAVALRGVEVRDARHRELMDAASSDQSGAKGIASLRAGIGTAYARADVQYLQECIKYYEARIAKREQEATK